MRRVTIVSLAVVIALLPLGCGAPAPSALSTNPESKSADEKVREAEKATAEAAKATRDEYVRQMQKRLDQLKAKYEDLKGRAAKAEGQAKNDLDKKVEEAKAKWDAAVRRLDELKEAGADRSEKIKDGVGSAIDDLEQAFD